MFMRRTTLLSLAAVAYAAHVPMVARKVGATTPVLEPFVDALPLPGRLRPVGLHQRPGFPAGLLYEVNARQVAQKLHRDLSATTVWGYQGSYPGPTIAAVTGQPVYVRYRNQLPGGEHPLWSPAFACVHGPDTSDPPGARRIVAHLHGGKVPADSDGFPEATILPGQTQSPVFFYPNRQEAATLWYHDHGLGITRLNVMMGLAAFYILHDPFELLLPLPRGRYDVPLAIQDRSINADGSLSYPTELEPEFFGDVMLVNGKVWPYLDVDRAKYRLRLLNGCNSRFLRLRFRNGAPFRQIASEQGLLPKPEPRTTITLGPGERADIVVDFAAFAAGTTIVLENSAASPFPNGDDPLIGEVMQFRVGARTGPVLKLPAILRRLVRAYVDRARQHDLCEDLRAAAVSRTRTFRLKEHMEHHCLNAADFVAVIEDEAGKVLWDEKAAEVPLNAVERWVFVNETIDTHPIHLHLVQFQVEARSGSAVPAGNAEGPGIWKDTVQVHPGETVQLLARFEGFRGRYPFHCHILEHEDHEMMRFFETV